MIRFLFCLFFLQFIGMHGQNKILRADSTDFELSQNFVKLDTAKSNIWQIAKPNKVFFGNAYSGSIALMTDSFNPYPVNNHSFFTVEYIDTLGFFDFYVGFWHKYETDSLRDGGYIEISADTGKTWVNLLSDTVRSYMGSYGSSWVSGWFYTKSDTILGKIPAFTGRALAWKYSEFEITAFVIFLKAKYKLYDIKKIMLRFSFKTDGIQNNKAGWIIDNISVGEKLLSGSVHDLIENEIRVNIYPNPASSKVIFEVNDEFQTSYTVQVFNSIGELVAVFNLDNGNKYTFNLTGFTTGVYYYNLQSINDKQGHGKFIIK